MTQNTPIPWNSIPTEKANCCQIHVKPLIEQINVLESKLQEQTERREKEYNQLLRMILTGKKDELQQRQKSGQEKTRNRKRQFSKGYRKITSPSSRRPAIKLPLNKKIFMKEQNDDNTIKKQSKIELKGTETYSLVDFQARILTCQSQMTKYSEQLSKIKELNEYLMGELLTIFQKIKHFENLSQTVKKHQPSQETVTSLVFDQQNNSHESDNIKIVNKQNNTSSRTVKSDLSKAELGEVAARVSEHEGMLYDLIELTKNLSRQIKHIPPQWSISPRE